MRTKPTRWGQSREKEKKLHPDDVIWAPGASHTWTPSWDFSTTHQNPFLMPVWAEFLSLALGRVLPDIASNRLWSFVLCVVACATGFKILFIYLLKKYFLFYFYKYSKPLWFLRPSRDLREFLITTVVYSSEMQPSMYMRVRTSVATGQGWKKLPWIWMLGSCTSRLGPRILKINVLAKLSMTTWCVL